MSVGLYSHTTRATGITLTAAIYNADHVNHITNQNPSMSGAYSDTVAQMQTNTDPGGVGSEVLAPTLAAELEYLRFCLKRLTGEAQWYVAPDATIAALAAASGTVTPPVTLAHAAAAPLNLRRTENDTTARDIYTLQSGSGAGNDFIRQVVGDAANAVASIRDFIGATELWRFSATDILNLIPIMVGTVAAGGRTIIHPDGYIDRVEMAASPSNPPADWGRMWFQDNGFGETNLYWKDSGGVITGLKVASQGHMEAAGVLDFLVTPGRQHFHPAHPKAVGSVINGATGEWGDFRHNIASISRSSTGIYVVTLTTGVALEAVPTIGGVGEADRISTFFQQDSTTQFTVTCKRTDTNAAIDNKFGFAIFGDMT